MSEEYEIALSFAGDDRTYVNKVADLLNKRGVKVFYDQYEQADLWGKDLYVHLQEIYGKKSKYTVMFISKYYAQKLWTNHERKSAQERAFLENSEYILPARFDDTDIPGMLKTTGYIDLRKTSPEELVGLIEKKLDRRETFWNTEATQAAHYIHQHHFGAHRGALLWCPQVSAIFANDGEKHEAKYVDLLKHKLGDRGLELLGIGITEDEYTWVILVSSEDARGLDDLIWECFSKTSPNTINQEYVEAQKGVALNRVYSYWKVPHKDKCGR